MHMCTNFMKRQRGKYPRDLHRENKTFKLKRSIDEIVERTMVTLITNSSNSAYKHSLQLSMANCLLSNKLAQYIWTCHCDKFAISTLQTNETEIIRQCMQCQKKLQQPSYVQTDATTSNNVAPKMLCVVESVLQWRANGYNNSLQHATGCANRRNM